jgi:glycine cleavage system aminomethyltransferase T
VRGKAGLFDVSHMCSIRWRGKDAIAFLESVTVADIEGLAMNTVRCRKCPQRVLARSAARRGGD